MMDHIPLLDAIDRYLEGLMEGEEKAQFEEFCRRDPEAGRVLDEQAAFRQQLLAYGERKDLEDKLQRAYARYAAPAGNGKPGKAADIPAMRRIAWKAAAIAAAVTLLISFAGGWWMTRSDNEKGSYIILRREIDNIRRSQTALLQDMHQPKAAPAAPGAYGGTGFAISGDGYVVTNAHVVAGADSIYVQNNQGEGYKADIVYQAAEYDLALLKITDSSFHLPAPPFSLKKTNAELGEEVYTLGYPRDEIVFGKGYISAETGYRGDSDAYQIALPVNPGNSGGPLVDAQGQVVGIISGKQSPSDDIAFAVKSTLLLKMLDSLNHQSPAAHKGLAAGVNRLQHLSQVNQIKKLQDFIFLVKVYN